VVFSIVLPVANAWTVASFGEFEYWLALINDFRGGDIVKVERKKPAYYTGQQIEREKSRR